VTVAAQIFGWDLWRVVVALAFVFAIVKVGLWFLRSLAMPAPEPPPPGEMRKVKMSFRCDVCGTEVRMTMAPDQDPPPPRHCLEDMRLVTPVDDL
jgi:hypothetical protein